MKRWRCKMRKKILKMWRGEDVKRRRCYDMKIWGYDVERWAREDLGFDGGVKIWRDGDVRMRKKILKMLRGEDAKRWRCEHVKMWGWRCKDVWQTVTLRRPFAQTLLTHRPFHTQTLLHTDAFTHRRFYTQTLLHTGAFTHRRFYTQTLFHTDPFTHKRFYTHRRFYTRTFLHTTAFTHRSFYTQTLLHTDPFTHRPFYTQTLLHTDAFTHRCLHTQLKSQFYLSFWHSNLVLCVKGSSGTLEIAILPQFLTLEPRFVREGFIRHTWNRNFTSVFDTRTSFRAKGLTFPLGTLEIAILPQFLTLEPRFVREGFIRHAWNRNFTSVFDTRTSFRA